MNIFSKFLIDKRIDKNIKRHIKFLGTLKDSQPRKTINEFAHIEIQIVVAQSTLGQISVAHKFAVVNICLTRHRIKYALMHDFGIVSNRKQHEDAYHVLESQLAS